MKLTRLIVVMGAVAASQGCKAGGTEVSTGLASRYDLYVINDAPLPLTTTGPGIDGSVFQVIGGEIVVKSRSMLLDIVRYQRTAGNGTKDPVIADTASLPFVVVDAGVRVTRRRTDGTTFDQTFTLDGDYLVGARSFKTVIGSETNPLVSTYRRSP